MFSQLSEGLDNVFRKLRGQGRISEKNITDAIREIRMALLEADVEFSVAKKLIERVKDQAMGEEVLKSVKPGEQMVKIFNDALAELLGADAAPLDLNPPGRILIVGLNGAGKTTSSGKLALHLKKQGKKVVLIACDLFRPAAIEQLCTLGEQIDVPVFRPEPGETDVLKVAKRAAKWAEEQHATISIYDTAGRQEVNDQLVAELKKLRDFLKPRETLLVADAATGQQAVNVANTFHEVIGLNGIILTKLDGDARGGAALSMREVTGVPIKFAGEGERLEQLFPFVPDRMASRILGMGDVVSMVERASEVIDQEKAEKIAKKIQKNKFDLNDFLEQMQMMRKMGPLQDILGMMPGMSKQLKNVEIDETRIGRTEAIVLSMTPKERTRPELLNISRRKRIAKGSGNSLLQVNQFLKQFGQMRKLMKSKGKMAKMMKQMGGMGGMGGGMPGMGGKTSKF